MDVPLALHMSGRPGQIMAGGRITTTVMFRLGIVKIKKSIYCTNERYHVLYVVRTLGL